jgi:predicted naringenin-chalcone synthase
VWASGGLEVTISPELWLEIEGQSKVIKLYFKAEKLSQHKVNLSLRLLDTTFGNLGHVGILDVRQGRLYEQTTEPPEGIDALLASEAAGLTALWNLLAP